MKETPEDRLAHVKYDYRMARYCAEQLQVQHASESFNAYRDAFALYLKNCIEFLVSKGELDEKHTPAAVEESSLDTHGTEKVHQIMAWLEENMSHLVALSVFTYLPKIVFPLIG